MSNRHEMMEISKLVFELTLTSSSGVDLDGLLGRLLTLLQSFPAMHVQPKGAILMFNPRHQLIQVAQHGLNGQWSANQIHQVFHEHAPALGTVPLITRYRCEQWNHDEPTADCRVLVLPMHSIDGPLGETLLLIDEHFMPDPVHFEFMTDLSHALTALVTRRILDETLKVRELELEDARTDAIRRLGVASEYRDNETGWHVMRMTNYAVAVAREMGLPEEQRERLFVVAPMHDVGKIGIADAILMKPGRLTPEEFDIMRNHTRIGETILQGDDALIATAREIAGAHHERWDGTGYPRGLKGEEIPVLARICSIADVFDALTTSRPYKLPWPVDEAVDWIRQGAGTLFDPEVVAAFERALPGILRIRELYRDDIIDPRQVLELPPLPMRAAPWVHWEDSLSVGIDVIDEHHRYLFDLVNDLHDVVVTKQGTREVARVLKTMAVYAQVHFRSEERMMEHHGFPFLSSQYQQHNDFQSRINLITHQTQPNSEQVL